ncbi:hypothetical protein [Nesterenkonia xinjiangensis]|uniref:Uncharacterized protein n=1 Tax=Nesterenkonia xinjiangensis TaxID=225327 RepID=A0A7Z0GLK1_9MICC|nr:hypothetical protein [Nesterenkonia xinjiangensis]NYJ77068.1 hypothetical protein [Nesterenkonia xinjiangensis]
MTLATGPDQAATEETRSWRIEGVESHLSELHGRICAAVERARTGGTASQAETEAIADAVIEELGVDYVEGCEGVWRYVTAWQGSMGD